MRTLYAFLCTSLDGRIADADGGLAWQSLDEEFDALSLNQLAETDAIVLGRRTYGEMAAYWPAETGRAYNPRVAELMNALPKLVVSTTLRPGDTTWENSEVLDVGDGTGLGAAVRELKNRPGRAVAVLGSPTLTARLLSAGVLDELRVLVNPVVLGEGPVLFDGLLSRATLRLTEARPLTSGAVLLNYRP
ncbi:MULTISPECIES: dihydrofolate reductase family protein [unclassified Streptomyces]|uniref:dihydrofolate reductase family protein n=1 Tax=unclassified Streptomyces TaxID=2593676 RepID=UPI0015E1668F|nr:MULTISPECIES: dihydrofolate reductase family protein [unclassified Streptomyces]